MSATVEIQERDGSYTAVDAETGAAGVGETRAMALAALAVKLGAQEGSPSGPATSSQDELRALGARVRERFDEADVTEADVEDAITWARSE